MWVSLIDNGLAFISAGVFSLADARDPIRRAVAEKLIRSSARTTRPTSLPLQPPFYSWQGSGYIFIVAAMTFALMKEANLPIYIGYAACIAVPPIVTFTLPGVTAMPNVLPTQFWERRPGRPRCIPGHRGGGHPF